MIFLPNFCFKNSKYFCLQGGKDKKFSQPLIHTLSSGFKLPETCLLLKLQLGLRCGPRDPTMRQRLSSDTKQVLHLENAFLCGVLTSDVFKQTLLVFSALTACAEHIYYHKLLLLRRILKDTLLYLYMGDILHWFCMGVSQQR